MCLFDTKLGGEGTNFPEAATFCHEGGCNAGPSDKPFLRAMGNVVLMEAGMDQLLAPFREEKEQTPREK